MINIEDIKTITLKPGQVLVVQTETRLPPRVAEDWKKQLEPLFPNNQVLIIDKSISLSVVDSAPLK